jgi:hypothetical protein
LVAPAFRAKPPILHRIEGALWLGAPQQPLALVFLFADEVSTAEVRVARLRARIDTV